MIWGVGVGVTGLINYETDVIENSPDFDWENVNLEELINSRIPFPFIFDNSTLSNGKG